MKTILVGTDGSHGAQVAVRRAIGLAGDTGASLTFVGVWPPPLPVLGDPYYQRALTEDLHEFVTRCTRPSQRPRRTESLLMSSWKETRRRS